jgi:hypothetical protein
MVPGAPSSPEWIAVQDIRNNPSSTKSGCVSPLLLEVVTGCVHKRGPFGKKCLFVVIVLFHSFSRPTIAHLLFSGDWLFPFCFVIQVTINGEASNISNISNIPMAAQGCRGG